MQTLVEEIEKQLKLTKVYKGTKVTKLSHSGSCYSLELDNGVTLDADSVIVTAPHKAAAGMLSELPAISHLKNMHSTSVANVALGFLKAPSKWSMRARVLSFQETVTLRSQPVRGRIKMAARSAGRQNAASGICRKSRRRIHCRSIR